MENRRCWWETGKAAATGAATDAAADAATELDGRERAPTSYCVCGACTSVASVHARACAMCVREPKQQVFAGWSDAIFCTVGFSRSSVFGVTAIKFMTFQPKLVDAQCMRTWCAQSIDHC